MKSIYEYIDISQDIVNYTDSSRFWVHAFENMEITGDIKVSLDGQIWKDYHNSTFYLSKGEYAYIYSYGKPSSIRYKGRFEVGGNILGFIMDVIPGYNNPKKLEDREFMSLFAGSDIVSAKELDLSCCILAEYCYEDMFNNCNLLEEAPKLPATELADYCYYQMFAGCKSLKEPPELPATRLAESCYEEMFFNCYRLQRTPKLHATALDNRCYRCMFEECRQLKKVELFATELKEGCYKYMFHNCESLVVVPSLPATELAMRCYYCMFYDCFSLSNIPDLPATELEEDCYYQMFYDCKQIKTIVLYADPKYSGKNWKIYAEEWIWGLSYRNVIIYKNPNLILPTGSSGIFKGWIQKPL